MRHTRKMQIQEPQAAKAYLIRAVSRLRLEMKRWRSERNGLRRLDTAIQYDTMKTTASKDPRTAKPAALATSFMLLIALLLVMSPSCATSKARFRVEISINQASLKTDRFKKHGAFIVDTKVVNTSGHIQRISVWTQYGWSWLSNNKLLSPGIEAAMNSMKQVVLKPNQEYRASVEMWASRKLAGTVRFRLGFVPNTLLPASTNRAQVKNWGGVFWSNAVRLRLHAR